MLVSLVGERIGFERRASSSFGSGRKAEGFEPLGKRSQGEGLTTELGGRSGPGAAGEGPAGSETVCVLPVLTRESMRDHNRDCLSRAQLRLDFSSGKL